MVNFNFFKMNGALVSVERTMKDKLLEAIVVVLLVGLWGMTVCFWNILPDRIPSHFNFSGEITAWSGKSSLFLLAGFATFGAFIMGVVAYNPRMINIPVKLNPKKLSVQYILMARMARVCNIILVLLFISILLSVAAPGLGIKSQLLDFMHILMMGGMFVTIFLYCLKIHKAGKFE